MKEKLDNVGAALRLKVLVYFPGGKGPRLMQTTGVSRTYVGPAPCLSDWELIDLVTNVQEWVPGWYLVALVK